MQALGFDHLSPASGLALSPGTPDWLLYLPDRVHLEVPQALQSQRAVYKRHALDAEHRKLARFVMCSYVGGDG